MRKADIDTALEAASACTEATWTWWLFDPDGDRLVLMPRPLCPVQVCLVFHGVRFLRLPFDMPPAVFDSAPGLERELRRPLPPDLSLAGLHVIRIHAAGREYCVVCAGARFYRGPDVR